jgi:dTDP-4-dehydrorhamnose 3,5-epimerase
MIFTKTPLKDAYIIDIEKKEDERGFFARGFCQKEFEEHGLNPEIVQANISYNAKKATLRGLHYQVEPHHETKLMRCARGAIFDVIIDMRKDSPTYGQWFGTELSEGSYRMLFVPGNFAHGFITLEDETEVIYQVSEFYTPGSERGIRWDDPAFKIEWPITPEIISEKDKNHENYQF